MLYSFLKFLMRITVRVFFRSITIRNKGAFPDKGPLLVLANHPSTFMDPIVIATLLDRKVFFLAKGELFKSGFAKWLLPKFNMIPVYRKQDDPTQMSKNQDTFNKCFEHLEKGGAILMFPEGISITERKLRPIKTGAARIAIGAEARNDFKLGVQVVNVGLNYADPHRFHRDLFVNIHEPIRVKDYAAEYAADPFRSAELLTEEIRQQLEKLVIAIEDEQTDELVKDIETLYTYKIAKEMGELNDKAGEFGITKNIIETVRHYQQHDPARVERMRERIRQYFHDLQMAGLQDIDIAKSGKGGSFLGSNLQALLFIIAGFPFYLYGLINNFLPFEIPGWCAKKISKSKEFIGAIGMVGGMFTFLIFYTLQVFLVWKLTHIQWLTIAYGLSLPLSGLFTYWYYHTVKRIRAKWTLMSLFYKKSVFISGLITERESILREIDKAKTEYVQM